MASDPSYHPFKAGNDKCVITPIYTADGKPSIVKTLSAADIFLCVDVILGVLWGREELGGECDCGGGSEVEG